MDLKKQKRFMTAPYWPTVLVLVALFIYAYSKRETMDISIFLNRKDLIFLCLMGCLLSIGELIHYSIHPSGIMVHFLWLPIRWIAWDKVTNAQYVHIQTTAGRKISKMKDHKIVVTLLGCAGFDPKTDNLIMFLLKHPIGALCIGFSEKNKDRYIEIFSHYCALQFKEGTTNKET